MWPYAVVAPLVSLIVIFFYLWGSFFLYGESRFPTNGEKLLLDGGLLILPAMTGLLAAWGTTRILAMRKRNAN
jgi:hypothetical protein